jgi:hypothetical protein
MISTIGSEPEEHLFFDTCPSTHATGRKELLHDYIQLKAPEEFEGIGKGAAGGIGALKFNLTFNNKTRRIRCEGVKRIPTLSGSILSALKLEELSIYADLEHKVLYQKINNDRVPLSRTLSNKYNRNA